MDADIQTQGFPTSGTSNREKAMRNGEKHYIPENPCHKGHALRYTVNHGCVVCSRLSTKKNNLKAAKRRAKKRGIEFSLKESDLDYSGVCPCCKKSFDGPPDKTLRTGPRDLAPSIDRIDPKKGYTPDNIQILCFKCNRIKSNATIEYLRMVLEFLEKQ